MRERSVHLASGVVIIVLLVLSGCVAPQKDVTPPAGTVPASGSSPGGNAGQATPVPTTPGLVSEATLFQTQTIPPTVYGTIPPTTSIPEDKVCLVSLEKLNMTFEVSSSAKSFDLRNPPLYINYSIVNPFMATGTKISKSRYSNKAEIEAQYSYYSPYSYFEITVRNPKSGEIYIQDGFGTRYDTTLNKTIQVNKPGELLIEMKGYNVTPVVGIWVKPLQNINASADLSHNECQSQAYVKKFNQGT